MFAAILGSEHAIKCAGYENLGIGGRHGERTNRLALHGIQRFKGLSTVVRAEQLAGFTFNAPGRNVQFPRVARIKNDVVEHVVRSRADMSKARPGKSAIARFKNLSGAGTQQDPVGIVGIVGQRTNIAPIGADHMRRRAMGIADEEGNNAGRCQGEPPSFAQH